MTIENISLSNSKKVWGPARFEIWASGSTNRLTTDCPSEPGNICISCRHQGFRDILKFVASVL